MMPSKAGVEIDGLVGGIGDEQTLDAAFVPLLGRIAAGGLILSEESVKTLKRKDGYLWLMPENTDYEPINVDHAKILERVATVMGKL